MNGENFNEEIKPVVIRENVPILADDSIINIASNAEKRIEAINKIKSIVFQVTNENDWVDQNGKPYLQASGCHKVANIFGISWRFIGEPKKVIEEDGNYRYDIQLEVYTGTRSIEVVGTRSTKDSFFTTRYKDKEKVTLPPSEVDAGDILKASITNTQANGISAILGIRNLTWDEIKGIDKSKTGKVKYGKSEMSDEAKDLKAEIKKMLTEMAIASKTDFSKLLQLYTTFTGKDGKEVMGKSKLEDISEKAMPVTYGKVKTVYEEFKGNKDDKAGGINGDNDRDIQFSNDEIPF